MGFLGAGTFPHNLIILLEIFQISCVPLRHSVAIFMSVRWGGVNVLLNFSDCHLTVLSFQIFQSSILPLQGGGCIYGAL